ncbi:hypothetical protein EYR41_006148 [Orbilia oligospora]|uniref:Uncharacterized protein n=2 Tax=Orbilia oligospora TaxID=2813651 RepID=A0A7C8KDT6_ORBOL|nr:hypothetical protein TWF751_011728 [Orbilia oligospora]KAF3255058.1 hypothetical protein TWF217_006754 [Orbilia oligospora]KAF3294168.1 hypothetical protein TWF132_003605 [Orbilia oligospora]TGJ70166.1 hypothetical protein EYR41_006148 [Orbilia oligospora]
MTSPGTLIPDLESAPTPIPSSSSPSSSSANPTTQDPYRNYHRSLPEPEGRLKRKAIASLGSHTLSKSSIANGSPGGKIGPQRTTKNIQKLKLLPAPDDGEGDEESGRDVYSQVTRIKDTTARRDAERLGKAERAHLPRTTAYCTAGKYNMEGLMKFLKSKTTTRGSNPKQFDECIYTPFSYLYQKRVREQTEQDLIDFQELQLTESAPAAIVGPDSPTLERNPDVTSDALSFVDTHLITPEIFLFEYGVVVIWGMTLQEEKRFLKDIAKFEMEKLGEEDVQVENFNFYVTSSYQPRIYNDFITLSAGSSYMVKLSISHAIAQSVKISLYEDLVDNTIEDTKSIPQDVALTGKVRMSRRKIMMHIGDLFILRININLQGSVMDSPELMWAEPQLEPIYQAARSYLEINQRVSLLNQRLDVISDLLQMLKEQLSHSQGERLEWVVIVLIAVEILVALVNVAVDLFASVD